MWVSFVDGGGYCLCRRLFFSEYYKDRGEQEREGVEKRKRKRKREGEKVGGRVKAVLT